MKVLKGLPAVLFLLFFLIGCSTVTGEVSGDKVGNLIQKLESEDPETRAQAAELLGQRKDKRVVPALIKALQD